MPEVGCVLPSEKLQAIATSVHAAASTRPTGAATTATATTGHGLRGTAIPLAIGSKKRDGPRRLRALAILALNGRVGLAHRSQSVEFRTAILTIILVQGHTNHQSFELLYQITDIFYLGL